MPGVFLFGMLLVATAVPATAAEEAVDPIVVTAQLQRVRSYMRIGREGKLAECYVTRSSKDEEIDAIACEAARQCTEEGRQESETFKACNERRRDELLALLILDRNAKKKAASENAQD